jgi:hypothetical protein
VDKPAGSDKKDTVEVSGTFTGKAVQGELFPSRDFK